MNVQTIELSLVRNTTFLRILHLVTFKRYTDTEVQVRYLRLKHERNETMISDLPLTVQGIQDYQFETLEFTNITQEFVGNRLFEIEKSNLINLYNNTLQEIHEEQFLAGDT